MSRQNAHQGGWIANFLIVGVLLVLGLVGTIYFLKSRNTSNVATTGTQTSENESTTQNDEKKDDSKPGTAKEDRKKDERTNETYRKEQTSKPDTVASEQSSEQKELPASGPSETFQAVAGLSLLTFSVSAYMQSRRADRLYKF